MQWVAYQTEDGDLYYYNTALQISSWTLPDGVLLQSEDGTAVSNDSAVDACEILNHGVEFQNEPSVVSNGHATAVSNIDSNVVPYRDESSVVSNSDEMEYGSEKERYGMKNQGDSKRVEHDKDTVEKEVMPIEGGGIVLNGLNEVDPHEVVVLDDVGGALRMDGVDFWKWDDDGIPAAFFVKSKEMLNVLLRTDVGRGRDKFGNSIVHRLVEIRNVEQISMVMYAVPQLLNGRNDDGDTALHVAVGNDFMDVVECLLAWDAHVDITNEKGHTALTIALSMDNVTCTQLLQVKLANQIHIVEQPALKDINNQFHDLEKIVLNTLQENKIATPTIKYIQQALHEFQQSLCEYVQDQDSKIVDLESTNKWLQKYQTEQACTNADHESYTQKFENVITPDMSPRVVNDSSEFNYTEFMNESASNYASKGEGGIGIEPYASQIENTLNEISATSSKTSSISMGDYIDDDNLQNEKQIPSDRIDAVWSKFFENMSINALNASNTTPQVISEEILSAIENNEVDYIRDQISSRISPDLSTKDGKTLLHFATEYGNTKIIGLLYDSGAVLDAVDSNGDSALHCGSYFGQFECIKFLLECAASTVIVNSDGDTALNVATYEGHFDCAALLVEYGSDPFRTNESGDHTYSLLCEKYPAFNSRKDSTLPSAVCKIRECIRDVLSTTEKCPSEKSVKKDEQSSSWNEVFAASAALAKLKSLESPEHDPQQSQLYQNAKFEYPKQSMMLIPPPEVLEALASQGNKSNVVLSPPPEVTRAYLESRKNERKLKSPTNRSVFDRYVKFDV